MVGDTHGELGAYRVSSLMKLHSIVDAYADAGVWQGHHHLEGKVDYG